MKQEVRESVETTREAPKSTFTIEHKRHLSKSMKARIPWNKGLTAKDDDRIASGIRNARWGKSLSLNARKHLSEYNKKHSRRR